MSKILNLTQVNEAAWDMLDGNDMLILDFLTREQAAKLLTALYETNDVASGYAVDYENNISVIASQTRISIIYQGHHSYYKHDGPICEYENLEDDLREILFVLTTALDRWTYQNEG